MTPQHLKNMVCLMIVESETHTCTCALTEFVPLVLKNANIHLTILYEASTCMTTLKKKGSGISPIAMGCTLSCLVAKVAFLEVREKIATLLAPKQLGLRVSTQKLLYILQGF